MHQRRVRAHGLQVGPQGLALGGRGERGGQLEHVGVGDRGAQGRRAGGGAAELELISDSLATALAKLRFYRLAFGPADAQARQSIDEARQITDAMFHGRFTVAWDARGAGMRRTTARLVYLAILCLEKSLPMGGSARVLIEDEAVGLAVEGCRVAPHSNLWLHVTHGVPVLDLGSGGVQFALLRQGLEASGHRIEVDFGETDVTVRMTAPTPILA